MKSAYDSQIEAMDLAIRKLAKKSKSYELTGPEGDLTGFWPSITYEGKPVASLLSKMEKAGIAYVKKELPNTEEITPCYYGYVPSQGYFVVGYNATYAANNFITHVHDKGTIVTFAPSGQALSFTRSMSEGNFRDTIYKKDMPKRYPDVCDLRLF
jgi:hypothetical protein